MGYRVRKKIKIESQDGKSKKVILLEASSYTDAKEQLFNFLEYVYQGETENNSDYHNEFKPEYIPDWLGDYNLKDLSQKDKVYLLIKKGHPKDWVRSTHLQSEYEEVYGETIKLSSLSTYLYRFYENGAVDRRGSRAQREYKLLVF
jgi:hypothetical protein